MKKYETFLIFTTALLFQIGNRLKDTRNLYLRNAIAKCQTLISSIELMKQENLNNEGWILYRCLIDRFVYLKYLASTDQYVEFKNWSFVEGYEYLQNAKSEELLQDVSNDPRFKATKDQSNNYNELKKKNNFEKPKPRNVLKKEGLNFLYKTGYEHASMRVHPMYEDGDEEYYNITRVSPNSYENFDHSDLLSNSYWMASLILQETLNQLELNTRDIVYDYIEDLRKDSNYLASFYIVAKFIDEGNDIFE